MKAQRIRPERAQQWSRFGPLEFAFWLPAAFLLFLGVGAAMHRLPLVIPLGYAICSAVTAGCYARDKSKARREEWRTPELVLHLLDLAGGWPGGLIAQRIFRHKTRKFSFQAIFWLGAAGHMVVWAWIFVRVPAEGDLLRFVENVINAWESAFMR
jgi:uncharacterized membrane protein YsdA (DUF1294 family)